MSFYDDLALALDEQGIDARIGERALSVPVNPDVEIRVEHLHYPPRPIPSTACSILVVPIDDGSDIVDSSLADADPVAMDELLAQPAASAGDRAARGRLRDAVGNDLGEDAADVLTRAQRDGAMLVSVAFSVEQAVDVINHHLALDSMVALIEVLLDGLDERCEVLEFEQSEHAAHCLYAEVGSESRLEVELDISEDGEVVSHLRMHASEESLDLGSITGEGELLDALAVIADSATLWEELLRVPIADDELVPGLLPLTPRRDHLHDARSGRNGDAGFADDDSIDDDDDDRDPIQ